MRNLKRLLLVLALNAVTAGAQPLPPPAPQALVDQAILRIFETHTGRRALCPFALRQDASALFIGASKPVAGQLQAICARESFAPIVLKTVDDMTSQVFDQRNSPGKRFFSNGYQEKYKGIMSYTLKGNATMFLMTPQEMESIEFLRAVAHEYAMSYDQLARLGYLDDPATWQQGVNTVFGRNIYTINPVFEDGCIPEIQKCQPGQPTVKEISCALRDPAVRYALATERAYRFEDQVVAELGLGDTSPPVASGSFVAAIERGSKLYQQFRGVIADEESKYNLLCPRLSENPRVRDRQTSQHAQFLEGMTLKFFKSSKTMRMSDLLSEPHVGPFMHDSDGGGPRPRGGGWDGGGRGGG